MMTENKDIRRLIRKHFSFLITDHDFYDDPEIDSNDIYSEVRFKKNGWRISIVTIAHGTKISMELISPKDDFGFLSHYFNTVDKDYNNESRTKNLEDSIQYHSEFIRTYGGDILTADYKRLTEILEFIKIEHDKWIEPLTKRDGDV